MEGPLEQVLKHPKSPDGPDFIDAATSGFTYDTLDYLQCPHGDQEDEDQADEGFGDCEPQI